jgi:zinc/manganese transport system substrate-binding protein
MRQLWYAIALLAGLGAGPAAAEPAAPVPVVASFSILADLIRNIGGDRVEVVALVGPDGDAHAYQPTPADAKALREARLVVVNGLGFEGWIDRLVETSGTSAPVVVATTGVVARKDKDTKGGTDPHAWQSISNARAYVANIRDGLIATDPSAAERYRANTEAYLGKLAALEAEVRAAIGKIPQGHRRIITTHDAFGYFGAAYGLDFLAPEGVSTEAEPSARDVARIIRQIKAQHIPAIFMENITNPRMIRRIAAESGARIGGTLFSDALSPPDGPAPTYQDMMRHNAKELSSALAP